MKAAAAAAVMVVAACTDLATSIGGRPGPEAGLLRGKQPIKSAGVTHAQRLTDGITAAPGDPVRTELTSLFSSPDGHVVYDLGSTVPIACVAVDADSGSRYKLAVSVGRGRVAADVDRGGDGRARHPDARRSQPDRVGPLRAPGRGSRRRPACRRRAVDARSDCLARWPPPLAPQRGTPVERSLLSKWWLFVALASAYVLAYRRKLPDFIKLLVAAPLGIGVAVAVQLGDAWPLSPSLYAPLAGGAAIVAAAVAVRVVVSRIRRRR